MEEKNHEVFEAEKLGTDVAEIGVRAYAIRD